MAQTGTIQDDCTILMDGNIGVGTPVIAIAKPCICTVATTASGLPIRDMENTVECLEVSVAGAYGNVGDKIKHTRWYNTESGTPVFVSDEYINQETFTIVTGVTGANTIPCTESSLKLTLSPRAVNVTTSVGQLLSSIITNTKVESFTIYVRSGTLNVNDGTTASTFATGESSSWGQGTSDYINTNSFVFNSIADITVTWEFEP